MFDVPYMVIAGILVTAATVTAFSMRTTKEFRYVELAIASLPALVLLSLFYSLAIHMYLSLGGWPASIGNQGFSDQLVAHADITVGCFGILAACTLVWPLVFLLCLVVPQYRRSLLALAAYAVSCYLCFGLVLLAPGRFLDWWCD